MFANGLLGGYWITDVDEHGQSVGFATRLINTLPTSLAKCRQVETACTACVMALCPKAGAKNHHGTAKVVGWRYFTADRQLDLDGTPSTVNRLNGELARSSPRVWREVIL